MKIISCFNIKGGVGKTATAVNLASLAARAGRRTLVWDLDPQAASTFYFRIKAKVKKGSHALVTGKRTLADAIKATDYPNLDLMPADLTFRDFELDLYGHGDIARQLKRLLKELKGEYDLVVIDSAPGLTHLAEALLRLSDYTLVPTIPTTLSLRTLKQLQKFCAASDIDGERLLPFFSMVDRRKSMHRTIEAHPPRKGGAFLKSSIPYASEVEQMGVHRAPLCAFAAGSRPAHAYDALWSELQERL